MSGIEEVLRDFFKDKGDVGRLALAIYKAFLKEGKKGVDKILEREVREAESGGAEVKRSKDKGV